MTKIELHRAADRLTWEMQGIGSVRDHLRLRSARAEFTLADGRTFSARRRNYLRWSVRVTTADGQALGGYDQTKRLRAGGPLTFDGGQYELVSLRKNLVHLGLRAGGQSLAEAGADNKRTVVEIPSVDALDPGLLLLFAWLGSQYGTYGNGLLRLGA